MQNARAVWLRAWVFYLQPMVTEGWTVRKRTRSVASATGRYGALGVADEVGHGANAERVP